MVTWRTFAILLAIGPIGTLALAACSSGDDAATATAKPAATASPAPATSSGSSATAKPAAATTSAGGSTATTSSSGGGHVYDVSNGKVPFEVCDVFTAKVVADAIGENASDFENNSLGKQIPPSPFVTGEQCEWKNFTSANGDGASVNTSFTATAAEAKSQLDTDCAGQESVDVGGDEACYPQFTGQLRAVKGNVYMVFMTGLGLDSTLNIQDVEKQMAEQTISHLP